MNLLVLYLSFSLVLTSSQCLKLDMAKLAESIANNETDSHSLSLLEQGKHMSPSEVLEYLWYLWAVLKENSMKTHEQFVEKLYKFANEEVTDCSNHSMVDLSDFDESWKSPIIVSFIEYYQMLYDEDCKWLLLTPEEKLSQSFVSRTSCHDLYKFNHNALGLKGTFQTMRAILKGGSWQCDSVKYRDYIQSLIDVTTCKEFDCCSKHVEDLIITPSSDLQRYHNQMGYRADIHCFRIIRNKLDFLTGREVDQSSPTSDTFNKQLFIYEELELMNSLKEFIDKLNVKQETDRLSRLYSIFMNPCYFLMNKRNVLDYETLQQAKAAGEYLTDVKSILNMGSCRKLQVAFRGVKYLLFNPEGKVIRKFDKSQKRYQTNREKILRRVDAGQSETRARLEVYLSSILPISKS